MRLIGTTRTAVAVLLLVAASLLSSGAGESPVAEVAVAKTAPPKREPQPVSIAWGGDVTLGSSYGNPPNGGRALLAPGTKVLKKALIGAVNYEGTFGPGGSSKCGARTKDCYAFQAPPGNARTLR